jgi:hypothetical protein
VEALPEAVPLLMKLCAEPSTSDSSSTTSNTTITLEQQQQLREGALRAMVSLTFVDRIALAVGYSQTSAATSSATSCVELEALSLHGAAVLVAALRDWDTAAAAAVVVTDGTLASSDITTSAAAAAATATATAGAAAGTTASAGTAGVTRAKLALLCLQNLSVHGACRRAVVDAGGVEALVAMHGCDDTTVR